MSGAAQVILPPASVPSASSTSTLPSALSSEAYLILPPAAQQQYLNSLRERVQQLRAQSLTGECQRLHASIQQANPQSQGALRDIAQVIFDDILSELTMDVCCRVHRENHTRGWATSATSTDLDVFGVPHPKKIPEKSFKCESCGQKSGSSKYAAHLEKCMGKGGRASSRSKRGGTNTISAPPSGSGSSNAIPSSSSNHAAAALAKAQLEDDAEIIAAASKSIPTIHGSSTNSITPSQLGGSHKISVSASPYASGSPTSASSPLPPFSNRSASAGGSGSGRNRVQNNGNSNAHLQSHQLQQHHHIPAVPMRDSPSPTEMAGLPSLPSIDGNGGSSSFSPPRTMDGQNMDGGNSPLGSAHPSFNQHGGHDLPNWPSDAAVGMKRKADPGASAGDKKRMRPVLKSDDFWIGPLPEPLPTVAEQGQPYIVSHMEAGLGTAPSMESLAEMLMRICGVPSNATQKMCCNKPQCTVHSDEDKALHKSRVLDGSAIVRFKRVKKRAPM